MELKTLKCPMLEIQVKLFTWCLLWLLPLGRTVGPTWPFWLEQFPLLMQIRKGNKHNLKLGFIK